MLYKMIEELNKRGFKGIWIDRSIWLCKELTLTEKVFLVEIDSLDNEKGCFALNEHFAEFFDLSISRVSKVITSLVSKDFISRELIYETGTRKIKQRILRKLKPPVESNGTSRGKVTDPPVEKGQESNTLNNTLNINSLSPFKKEDEVDDKRKPSASQQKNIVADEIYSYYTSKFPKGTKKHKRAVGIDRIKKALLISDEETIKGAIDNYFSDKKNELKNKDYQYIKAIENFFGMERGTSIKFIDNFKIDSKSVKKVTGINISKGLDNLSNEEIGASVAMGGGIKKWKEKNREKLLEIRVDNPEKFNSMVKLLKEIQEEENKNLYL